MPQEAGRPRDRAILLLTEGDLFLVLFLLGSGTGESYSTVGYINQHPELALGSSRRLIHSLEIRE